MVGETKRRVQAGRRDDTEGGARSKTMRLGESTEDVQRKLHHHFNETAFMQGQWRVCTWCVGVCGMPCLRAWGTPNSPPLLPAIVAPRAIHLFSVSLI